MGTSQKARVFKQLRSVGYVPCRPRSPYLSSKRRPPPVAPSSPWHPQLCFFAVNLLISINTMTGDGLENHSFIYLEFPNHSFINIYIYIWKYHQIRIYLGKLLKRKKHILKNHSPEIPVRENSKVVIICPDLWQFDAI